MKRVERAAEKMSSGWGWVGVGAVMREGYIVDYVWRGGEGVLRNHWRHDLDSVCRGLVVE